MIKNGAVLRDERNTVPVSGGRGGGSLLRDALYFLSLRVIFSPLRVIFTM